MPGSTTAEKLLQLIKGDSSREQAPAPEAASAASPRLTLIDSSEKLLPSFEAARAPVVESHPETEAAPAWLEAVLALLRSVAEDVAALRRQSSSSRRTATKALLSLSEAARRLGIARGEALQDLIRAKRVKVVRVNGRPRIAAAEIERICREGA